MSDLLLDTHAVLWFFWDDPLRSSTAKVVIENLTQTAITESGVAVVTNFSRDRLECFTVDPITFLVAQVRTGILPDGISLDRNLRDLF